LLDHAVEEFLGDLSNYYIQTRYPEEIEFLGAKITKEAAEDMLRRTEEVAQWLFSMLK
jgi:HEPN domain-containing protein